MFTHKVVDAAQTFVIEVRGDQFSAICEMPLELVCKPAGSYQTRELLWNSRSVCRVSFNAVLEQMTVEQMAPK